MNKKNLMKNIKGNPQIAITVGLVEHGYQIDFYDEDGESIATECRDFGGSYTIESLINCTIATMAKSMQNVEKNCQKHLKEVKFINI